MGAVLKILGFVLAAVGLVVWLGGTGFIAWDIARDALAREAMPEKVGGFVAVAGLIIALVGSVLVLRVTHNPISFAICFACGLLAFFGGLKLNPKDLASEPVSLGIAVAVLAIPALTLAVTRKTIPFLSSVAVLGLVAAGALYFTGVPMGAAPPTETASAGDGALPPAAGPSGEEKAAADAAASANQPAPAPPRAEPKPEMAAPAPPPVTEEASRDDGIVAGAGAPEIAAAPPPAAAPSKPAVRSRGLGGIIGSIAGGTLGAARQPSPPPPAPMPPAAGPAGEPRSADLAAPSGGGIASRSDDLAAPSGSGATAAASAPPPAAAPATTEAAKPPEPSDFPLRTADLKFNKPDKMEYGTEYTIGAMIALPGAETPAVLGNVGPTVTKTTKITRKVRVELDSPSNDFEIKALNPDNVFLITPQTSGEWNWSVTPLKEGAKRQLRLRVIGLIESDGVSQGEGVIITHNETIDVTVTPMGRVKLISQNVVENWEPVAGALGAIGGIWAFIVNLFAGLRRKREAKA